MRLGLPCGSDELHPSVTGGLAAPPGAVAKTVGTVGLGCFQHQLVVTRLCTRFLLTWFQVLKEIAF